MFIAWLLATPGPSFAPFPKPLHFPFLPSAHFSASSAAAQAVFLFLNRPSNATVPLCYLKATHRHLSFPEPELARRVGPTTLKVPAAWLNHAAGLQPPEPAPPANLLSQL